MTTLRDATLMLERGVNDVLGDEITYTRADGEALTFNAWVEFDTRIVSPGQSAASVDVVTIEVPMATIPDISRDDRIAVAVLPGKLFAPTKWERGAGGATWNIAPKAVKPDQTNGG